MELTHSNDALANISVFKTVCSVCGMTHYTSLEQDVQSVWCACDCGHVFPMDNRTRWQ